MVEKDLVALKKHVKTAFELRTYTLKRDTLEYAVNILRNLDDSQRPLWIARVLDVISKQSLNSPLLGIETLKSAVAICENKKSRKSSASRISILIYSLSLFNVIDIFSAPRFDYDETSRKLVSIPQQPSAIGKCVDAIELLRNRLKFVIQRFLRSSSSGKYQLSTVEKLLGSRCKQSNVIVLGILTQSSVDSYQLEDLTGSINVDLSNATFHSGLYTDGCIMLLEGYYNADLLTVTGVGLPPVENAEMTRSYFGDANWFGGESAKAYASQPQLRDANARNKDARIVFISDVWLDDPKVWLRSLFTSHFYSLIPVIYLHIHFFRR
ncbi:unnamed protein product [Anisakis simplex]|uniref:Probable DNA polymerase epsilon subunit 2 (inferred by orthology to a C. elegans protein) n=1 Tax=Anisakis simplex TaxID=6269 RepID=A0A0M3J094_ANISI|nr:unnamed protein product [Anisakis simplex]